MIIINNTCHPSPSNSQLETTNSMSHVHKSVELLQATYKRETSEWRHGNGSARVY